MRISNMSFRYDGNKFVTVVDSKTLCAQYDNNSVRILIRRPAEFENHNLVLVFTHGHKKYISFDLGLEDTFIVPDILTQKSTVYMQPEFQRNDDVVHGSIVWFRLEKSMPAAITPPVEPAPDYILIAVDPYALVSGDYDMWIESPTPKELSAGEYELTLQGVI